MDVSVRDSPRFFWVSDHFLNPHDSENADRFSFPTCLPAGRSIDYGKREAVRLLR